MQTCRDAAGIAHYGFTVLARMAARVRNGIETAETGRAFAEAGIHQAQQMTAARVLISGIARPVAWHDAARIRP